MTAGFGLQGATLPNRSGIYTKMASFTGDFTWFKHSYAYLNWFKLLKGFCFTWCRQTGKPTTTIFYITAVDRVSAWHAIIQKLLGHPIQMGMGLAELLPIVKLHLHISDQMFVILQIIIIEPLFIIENIKNVWQHTTEAGPSQTRVKQFI